MEKLKKITISAIVADVIAILILAKIAMDANVIIACCLILAILGFGIDLSRAVIFYSKHFNK